MKDLSFSENEKIKFYYLRDGQNKPTITVCLLKAGSYMAKGLALCGDSDMPRKATGRHIALGRAKKALHRGESAEPLRTARAKCVYYDITGELPPFTTKAIFQPQLDDFERTLFND